MARRHTHTQTAMWNCVPPVCVSMYVWVCNNSFGSRSSNGYSYTLDIQSCNVKLRHDARVSVECVWDWGGMGAKGGPHFVMNLNQLCVQPASYKRHTWTRQTYYIISNEICFPMVLLLILRFNILTSIYVSFSIFFSRINFCLDFFLFKGEKNSTIHILHRKKKIENASIYKISPNILLPINPIAHHS